MKFLIKLLGLVALAYFVPKFCHKQTDGFTLSKIHSNLSYNPKWEVCEKNNEPPQRLDQIFSQRFTYLGSGGQCYAFVSEDNKYVIKFFKHHLRRVSPLIKYLPLPPKLAEKRNLQKIKRTKKLQRDFNSYVLAYTHLFEESGLLYLHLNKTGSLHQIARVIDKLSIEHKIDLDKVEFILQKKGNLALTHLQKLIQEEKFTKAKEAIESICDLILIRCNKGIYDEDAKIHRNFGFIGNRAILIDIGRLKIDESRKNPKVQQRDLREITQRLENYLEEMSPQLAKHLNHYLSEMQR